MAGWGLPREPDRVLSMSQREFVIPAEGTVEYQYFVVDPGFTEDQWVTSVQVLPGNPSVVHHSIVFIRPPDGAKFRGIGWLGAYVPGQRTAPFPAGSAIRVPAGSKLVFQQHYTPNGRQQTDVTKIGMTFGDPAHISEEIYSVVGIDQEFEIPPHANDHEVQAKVGYFPRHGRLLAIMPHMHFRGKSFRLWAETSGNSQVLLDVPVYDFNWQHSYQLKSPLSLSAIDSLQFQTVFDNSKSNRVNPDPEQYVTWGDQTWEEMAVVFLAVAVPLGEQPETARNEQSTASNETPTGISSATQARIMAEADRILARFDRNQDGEITRYETPLVFRRYEFYDIDRDGDGRLTRAELESAARGRVE